MNVNARTLTVIAATFVVVAVAAVAFWQSSLSAHEPAVIPNTGIVFPANTTNEMDLGQMDEQAKLEAYPLTVPMATGELDLGQADERAKLESYPIYFPPASGELDLGQMDEKAKMEAYPIAVLPFTGELDLGQQDEIAKRGY